MAVLFIILIVGIIVAGICYSNYLARKRREAMAALAATLGLTYRAGKDHSLPSRFNFLNKLAQGSNRYAYNILSGSYRGQEVMVFDYHYETYSTDSKGRRQTHHHYFSFFILRLPGVFPELVITQESFFSKIVQFFGYDDIDFESAEFSRNFVVRSPDKKFAYDFCNGQMIEYLLDNRDLQVEVEHDSLGLFFGHCLSPDEIPHQLNRLLAVRQLIPDYVFANR